MYLAYEIRKAAERLDEIIRRLREVDESGLSSIQTLWTHQNDWIWGRIIRQLYAAKTLPRFAVAIGAIARELCAPICAKKCYRLTTHGELLSRNQVGG